MISHNHFSIFVGQALPKAAVPESDTPTLYRDFVGAKELNSQDTNFRLGPDITLVRNSYATFTNVAGFIGFTRNIQNYNSIPRFNHTPSGEYLGLLIEDQTTNLVSYSDTFAYNCSAQQVLVEGAEFPQVNGVYTIDFGAVPQNHNVPTSLVTYRNANGFTLTGNRSNNIWIIGGYTIPGNVSSRYNIQSKFSSICPMGYEADDWFITSTLSGDPPTSITEVAPLVNGLWQPINGTAGTFVGGYQPAIQATDGVFIGGYGSGLTITVPFEATPLLGTFMRDTSATGFHGIRWGNTPFPFFGNPLPIEAYTRSIFVKKGTARYIIISCSPTVSAPAGGGNPDFPSVANIFDFDLPGFTQQFTVPVPFFEAYPDGWYRIGLVRQSANPTTSHFSIALCNGPNFEDANFAGDPNNPLDVYIWGAQVEKGPFATSYIPTRGTQVTRAADNVYVAGNNFTSFYNVTAGSYITTINQNNVYDSRAFATFIGDNGSKFVTLGSTLCGDTHRFISTTGLTATTGQVEPDQFYTIGFALSYNSFELVQDSAILDQQELGEWPQAPFALTKYQLGQFDNSKFLNGHVRKLAYYPTRLTDQQLINASFEQEAENYLNAVEEADGQSLELAYKTAVANFVGNLKNDGIWSQITGIGILAGARTLSGALIPIKGPAPTSFNFSLSDYTRSGGLSGDAFTKYIDTNIGTNARPATSRHMATYVTKPPTNTGGSLYSGTLRVIMGTGFAGSPLSATDFLHINTGTSISNLFGALAGRFGLSQFSTFANQNIPGFKGMSKTGNTTTHNINDVISTVTRISYYIDAPLSILLFGGRNASAPEEPISYLSDSALTFYSVGSAVDIEKLGSRVNTLMQTISTLT